MCSPRRSSQYRVAVLGGRNTWLTTALRARAKGDRCTLGAPTGAAAARGRRSTRPTLLGPIAGTPPSLGFTNLRSSACPPLRGESHQAAAGGSRQHLRNLRDVFTRNHDQTVRDMNNGDIRKKTDPAERGVAPRDAGRCRPGASHEAAFTGQDGRDRGHLVRARVRRHHDRLLGAWRGQASPLGALLDSAAWTPVGRGRSCGVRAG